MTSISLSEAQAHLAEIVRGLANGDVVAVTDGDTVVAKIIGESQPKKSRPGPGLCRGMIEIISEDEEHLEDFREYMP